MRITDTNRRERAPGPTLGTVVLWVTAWLLTAFGALGRRTGRAQVRTTLAAEYDTQLADWCEDTGHRARVSAGTAGCGRSDD
jgi:hypothetical protein